MFGSFNIAELFSGLASRVMRGRSLPVIISGQTSLALASDIAQEMGAELISTDCKHFDDNELRVVINENVRGQEVVVIGSGAGNPNDIEKENRLLLRAAKKHGASSITLLLPYMTYGRSDSDFGRRSAVGLVDTVEGYRDLCDNIIVADPHNPLLTLEKFRDAQHINNALITEFGYLYGKQLDQLFRDKIISRDNLMLTYPDAGASKRISEVFRKGLYSAANLNLDPSESDEWNQISASRNRSTEVKRFSFTEDVAGKDIVIFEDMIASGGTACEIAKILKDKGANSVILFSTSGLFTPKNKISAEACLDEIQDIIDNGADSETTLKEIQASITKQKESVVSVIKKIDNSALDAVFITDTYDHSESDPAVAKAIAESNVIHTIKTGPMLSAVVEAVLKKIRPGRMTVENSVSAILTGTHQKQKYGNGPFRPAEIKPNARLYRLVA